MTVARDTQLVIETLANTNPKLRDTQLVIETLANTNPKLRGTQIVIETLCDNVADDVVSTGSYRFFFGS